MTRSHDLPPAPAGAAALLCLGLLALAPGLTGTTDVRTLALASLGLAVLVALGAVALRTGLARARSRTPVRVVLVCGPGDVLDLVRAADRATAPAYDPVATWQPGPVVEVGPDPARQLSVIRRHRASETALLDVVRLHRADAVLAVPGPEVGPAELHLWRAALAALGVDLLVTTGLRDVAPDRVGVTTVGGLGVLSVRPQPHPTPWAAMYSRIRSESSGRQTTRSGR